MTTYEQRELAGVSPISEPALPTESKYDSDDRRDGAKSDRIATKELRVFNQPMIDATESKKIELKKALNDRDTAVLQALQNCKNISAEEAIHAPYAHYRQAA